MSFPGDNPVMYNDGKEKLEVGAVRVVFATPLIFFWFIMMRVFLILQAK